MFTGEWFGIAAGTLTTVAFVPQVLLTWRTRDTRGISLGMYAMFVAGIACWLAYGVHLGSWPMMVSNAVVLGLAGPVLAMKWANRRHDRTQR